MPPDTPDEEKRGHMPFAIGLAEALFDKGRLRGE
jgi:hypothetical protein